MPPAPRSAGGRAARRILELYRSIHHSYAGLLAKEACFQGKSTPVTIQRRLSKLKRTPVYEPCAPHDIECLYRTLCFGYTPLRRLDFRAFLFLGPTKAL